MYTHPDFVLDMAREHQRDLIEEAGRHRLLSLARLARRERRDKASKPSVSGVAGTLAPCGPREAAPAR
jgi:hypothetical protein